MKRLIHASSQGVYDLSNPPEKINREWRSNGAGRVYQASKVACDEVLTAYAAYYDFELALPRFASVYGYGPYTGGGNVGIDMHAMLTAALEGRLAPMGPGIADRNDFVYVKDIAQGLNPSPMRRAWSIRFTIWERGFAPVSTISNWLCGAFSGTCNSAAMSRRGRGPRWISHARERNWVTSLIST